MARFERAKKTNQLVQSMVWLSVALAAGTLAYSSYASYDGQQRLVALKADLSAPARDTALLAENASLSAEIDLLHREVLARDDTQAQLEARLALLEASTETILTGSLPSDVNEGSADMQAKAQDEPRQPVRMVYPAPQPAEVAMTTTPPETIAAQGNLVSVGELESAGPTPPTTGALPPAGQNDPVTQSLARFASPAARLADQDVTQAEFALSLATVDTPRSGQDLWVALAKAHEDVLRHLSPKIAIKDVTGDGISLRLLAGPIGNAADAARLCAMLAARGVPCETMPFEGQRLALRQ